MRELTAYIAWLSNSVYTIYSQGEPFWASTYSNQEYFMRAYARMQHDASDAGYAELLAWATHRIESAIYYETQSIPPAYYDLYRQAAEIARPSGMIRSRMPFHRPPYQGVTTSAGATAQQLPKRQAFLLAVAAFNDLTPARRAQLYAAATAAGMWYYNYYLQGSLAMIKNIYHLKGTCPATTFTDLTIGATVQTDKAFIHVHGFCKFNLGSSYLTGPFLAYFVDSTTVRVTAPIPDMETAIAFYADVIEYY